MKKLQARQGDVLIERIPKPQGKKLLGTKYRVVPREAGRVILAHGEATGHAHAILEEQVELLELETGERLLVSEQGLRIVHDEHNPIDLPSGYYKVIRQREYAPDAIRNVAD